MVITNKFNKTQRISLLIVGVYEQNDDLTLKKLHCSVGIAV